MKSRSRFSSIFTCIFLSFCILLFLLAATSPASAWNYNQMARLVLGQVTFTSNGMATSQSGMRTPANVAVDPATGVIFIADTYNNRVLHYASQVALSNGQAASGELGQVDFTSHTPAAGRSGMDNPGGLALDGAGRLWVADYNNSRVLRFDDASSKPNGAPADGVLGQPDFTSSAFAATQSRMYRPVGVTIDSAGTLWVGDYGNNRVLRFNNAAGKPNGAPADGVLGQANFTSHALATNQAGMSTPSGVVLDSSGRLWVADSSNFRVLRFDHAAGKANGALADGVLGQLDFTSRLIGAGQSGMYFPLGVALDGAGRLWVADMSNNRVLRFDNPADKANGALADGVLGQVDFTSNSSATSQSGMRQPYGVAVDSIGRLWVADTYNNRILMFQDPATILFLPLLQR